MTTSPEAVPTVWTRTDEDFFGLVARVFAPPFLWGAGALLASYDPPTGRVRRPVGSAEPLGWADPLGERPARAQR